MKNYPQWVCSTCAIMAGGRSPQCATFHNDTCEVCGEFKTVTEPRDYGYPKFTKLFKPKEKEMSLLAMHMSNIDDLAEDDEIVQLEKKLQEAKERAKNVNTIDGRFARLHRQIDQHTTKFQGFLDDWEKISLDITARLNLLEIAQLQKDKVAVEAPKKNRKLLSLKTPIEKVFRFSQRICNCLHNEGILYIGNLLNWSSSELLLLPFFGEKSLRELQDELAKYDMFLSMQTDEEWDRRVDLETEDDLLTIGGRDKKLKQVVWPIFPRGKTERNINVVLEVESGKKYEDLVTSYRISTSRIEQIIKILIQKYRTFCQEYPGRYNGKRDDFKQWLIDFKSNLATE